MRSWKGFMAASLPQLPLALPFKLWGHGVCCPWYLVTWLILVSHLDSLLEEKPLMSKVSMGKDELPLHPFLCKISHAFRRLNLTIDELSTMRITFQWWFMDFGGRRPLNYLYNEVILLTASKVILWNKKSRTCKFVLFINWNLY